MRALVLVVAVLACAGSSSLLGGDDRAAPQPQPQAKAGRDVHTIVQYGRNDPGKVTIFHSTTNDMTTAIAGGMIVTTDQGTNVALAASVLTYGGGGLDLANVPEAGVRLAATLASQSYRFATCNAMSVFIDGDIQKTVPTDYTQSIGSSGYHMEQFTIHLPYESLAAMTRSRILRVRLCTETMTLSTEQIGTLSELELTVRQMRRH
jgi:hypothetical protein